MELFKTITKRNGETQSFDKGRILRALEKAFLSESRAAPDTVSMLADQIISDVFERYSNKQVIRVEDVQDLVEEHLMKGGYYKIAKNYILYRSTHSKQREAEVLSQIKEQTLEVKVGDADTVIFNSTIIEERLRQLAPDLMRVSISEMLAAITKQVYHKISQKEINALILSSARDRIEQHYEYSYLASRIALNFLYTSILSDRVNSDTIAQKYKDKFTDYIHSGIAYELLNPELANFDLPTLSEAIDVNKDKKFLYLGTQILQDRYLLRDRSDDMNVFELPQWFWMRVAMGLSLKEENKTERAIEFYNVLSSLDLVSSTPTLFNSGTIHSQMSSCYLNIADDSLDGIFKLFSDNAQLSKWAGGIGTDWSNIRSTGSKIKGTNGQSQGVIPFIKIFNDVALAVNQGGKRKGAMCAYMEVWHLDFEQFLELKKNTGDERRRAHDINTAAWIPDLFMKRVKADGDWTYFCPSDTPELHDLVGKAFEAKYIEYENKNIGRSKTVKAKDVWRKILTMLYETGHPWITFKDTCNIRSPQDHVGVVHSSNLCTEITLNTSKDETAVCNLASINLAQMITDGKLDEEKIKRTVTTGIRMLDNVIDNNYYPTPEAERANLRHRAVGLGLMGFQDALYQLELSYESEGCMTFADRSMEMISYYAISASSDLSKERGSYETYKGSKWERGILPIDTLDVLERERGEKVTINRNRTLDWASLRDKIKECGMRNSNTMAIAPTATISNICGVYPCTEPAYKNMYMKENLSGNFIVMNKFMIDDLEKMNMWNDDMLKQLKLYNGSISEITMIPDKIKAKYKETFEIDMKWIIKSSSLRAKWIDQSASTNVFVVTQSGKQLSELYMAAWEQGLKTTYYLRSLGATQVTKMVETNTIASEPEPKRTNKIIDASPIVAPSLTTMMDADCEACQ
ncbi:ribonucleoside-diphosphate reductase subunit alpha [Candidatus Marinamargulisbacteria bacterium SCGC AAA071-K20]|nr:ribonucleoside-diphosphate reductase subunit alpha [Candidatus Marinamargulisbacteria bacterium SCGC AAA071-K20]